MKKKFLMLVLCAALVGCGKDKSARDRNEEEIAQPETVEEQAEAPETVEPEIVVTETQETDAAEEPAEAEVQEPEKPADFGGDMNAAKQSDKGSLDTLSGRYNMSRDGQVYEGLEYVFMKDTYSVTETGTYSMSADGITMQHGALPETTYKIEQTDGEYRLTNDAGNMIPLTFKEGTDGLSGSSAFEGTYSMSASQGYIFHSDGTMETINTDSFELDGNTVLLGVDRYDWNASGTGIDISTNGTSLYTLVPVG